MELPAHSFLENKQILGMAKEAYQDGLHQSEDGFKRARGHATQTCSLF